MTTILVPLVALALAGPVALEKTETILLRPGAKLPAGTPAEKVVERGVAGVKDRAISDVSEPALTVYLPPPEKATGAAIVVCPGGGYQRLAIDKEGHDVARWLTSQGVAGMVLKYRLPGADNMKLAKGDLADATRAAKVALEDAEDAMRIVRENAVRWHLRPDAVGIMGFSAGGHLAAMMAMVSTPRNRPDFLVLVYPAIPQRIEASGPSAPGVSAATPRTFLVHADDDKSAPPDGSVRFYQALKKANVPAELHIYAHGGHGFGMRKSDQPVAAWPAALAAWLAEARKPAPSATR
jgi:acetyl esterase/lipase